MFWILAAGCHFLHLFKVKLCERGRYSKNLSICVSVIRRSSKLSEHGWSSRTDRKILLVEGKLAGEIFPCLIFFPSEPKNAGADHHFHLQGREKQIVAQSKSNTPPPFVCSFYLSYVLIFFFISSLAYWMFLICSSHFISLSATFHILPHLRCCLCNYCLSLSLFWIFALLSLESLILSEGASALFVQRLWRWFSFNVQRQQLFQHINVLTAQTTTAPETVTEHRRYGDTLAGISLCDDSLSTNHWTAVCSSALLVTYHCEDCSGVYLLFWRY